MNAAGILFVGLGYLLGNEQARNKFSETIQQLAGQGIDMINKVGGESDVHEADKESTEE